jgi:hypothetical protein
VTQLAGQSRNRSLVRPCALPFRQRKKEFEIPNISIKGDGRPIIIDDENDVRLQKQTDDTALHLQYCHSPTMNGNGHGNECSTSMDMDRDLTDAAPEKGVASTLSTMMMPTATAIATATVAKGDTTMNVHDDSIPSIHEDAEQVAAWATRQLASPVHLQSLRIVYDTLVDRQHPPPTLRYRVAAPSQQQQRDDEPEPQNLTSALRMTCQLLLEIHRQQQQQVLTTSQRYCIETTERRCRWLLELVIGNCDDTDKEHAAANNPNHLPSVPVGGSYSSDRAGGNRVIHLCRRRPAVNESNSGHTEWTYDYVAAKDDKDDGNLLPTRAQYAKVPNLRVRPGYQNDNDTAEEHDDDDEDDDNDGNMLPSRAELAAEERMLWRMADTPIPSETYGGAPPIPSIYDQQS